MGDLVDLDIFRKQKEKEIAEQEEKERLEKEQEDADAVEYMRSVLAQVMENIGSPHTTGTMIYVPLTDDDYFSQFQVDSGYDENGDWYNSWETEGFNGEDYFCESEDED